MTRSALDEVIDFAPGSGWTAVDHHATEERHFVISGEVIEGDTAYVAR